MWISPSPRYIWHHPLCYHYITLCSDMLRYVALRINISLIRLNDYSCSCSEIPNNCFHLRTCLLLFIFIRFIAPFVKRADITPTESFYYAFCGFSYKGAMPSPMVICITFLLCVSNLRLYAFTSILYATDGYSITVFHHNSTVLSRCLTQHWAPVQEQSTFPSDC